MVHLNPEHNSRLRTRPRTTWVVGSFISTLLFGFVVLALASESRSRQYGVKTLKDNRALEQLEARLLEKQLFAQPSQAAPARSLSVSRTAQASALRRTPHPAVLTSQFKKATSVEDLFQTLCTNKKYLNDIHLSACWISLGRLSRGEPVGQWLRKNLKGSWTCLIEHTVEAAKAGEIGARTLSNVATGAARSAKGKAPSSLFAALSVAVESRVNELNAEELSNTAWAFATAGQSDARLFAILARSAEHRASEFDAQSLTNLAWAFASVGHSDAVLFTVLAREVLMRMHEFSSQEITKIAWAFAKLGESNAALFAALARKTERLADKLNPHNCANLAWAFARAGQSNSALFTALAKVSVRQIQQFTAQGISNLAWAFATVGRWDKELFAAVAKVTEQRLSQFNSQNLANTAWAFAKVGQPDVVLFAALARAIEKRVNDFKPKELAITAWAFATVGQSNVQLFATLAQAAEQHIDECKIQDLTNIAWAYAVVDYYPKELFGSKFIQRCESVLQKGSDIPQQHLAQLHQWVLWHRELGLSEPFSQRSRDRCLAAFKAFESNPSQTQRQVTATLTQLGLGAGLEQEVNIKQGYSVDGFVELKGERIALEVDGPSHFLGGIGSHVATGATMLKRRQLRALGFRLVVVPYWEWGQVKSNSAKRRDYLLRVLRFAAPRKSPVQTRFKPRLFGPRLQPSVGR